MNFASPVRSVIKTLHRLIPQSVRPLLFRGMKRYFPLCRSSVRRFYYPDASFDVIFCSHVLEHVSDDRKALREFHRVLSPGGWCMIRIPVTDPTTFEDRTITDPEERLRVFGQRDHVRRYGPDVRDRMEEAGFQVDEIATEDVASAEEARRTGLMGGDRVYVWEGVGSKHGIHLASVPRFIGMVNVGPRASLVLSCRKETAEAG